MEKITIIGAGVTGILCATELVERGCDGENIMLIDRGNCPYFRKPEEIMHGFLGAGLFSDGKIVYKANQIGGHLAKYCGVVKSEYLVNELLRYIVKFHPNPKEIMKSDPIDEPDFIKPYFELRMAPTYHVGTNYLSKIGEKWYDYLLNKGVRFLWNKTVTDVDFKQQKIQFKEQDNYLKYDRLVYATGKSGIDLTQKLIEKHKLKTEPKPVQIGVRFEAPQKYFQKILDVAYDFKLYRKMKDVSIRSFCVNSNAAYIAEEETYGMVSYNGHSYKDESKRNDLVNFGIMMEIKDIKNPFEWAKTFVFKCQYGFSGVYCSPERKPSITDVEIRNSVEEELDYCFGKYAKYINMYIRDLDKIFNFRTDFGFYLPEVKFLSDEVIVNYNDLSLIKYPNVHFGGDSLSARGIAVSAAQGLYVAESILRK